ncbi:MAG: hypothetical protein WAT77_01580 [Paracoccaceae bacterium]
MRQLVLVLGLIAAAGAAFAEEGWRKLGADELNKALAARTVAYENGASQTFDIVGTTDYDSGTFSAGKWKIDGDRYCSVWPPSEKWACYDVEVSSDGLGLKFIADDGSATIGRYVDLQ